MEIGKNYGLKILPPPGRVNGGLLWSALFCGNPNGIVASSPRLRGTSYLGSRSRKGFNRNAVVANAARDERRGMATTPLGLWFSSDVFPISSCLATLGFETESRWD